MQIQDPIPEEAPVRVARLVGPPPTGAPLATLALAAVVLLAAVGIVAAGGWRFRPGDLAQEPVLYALGAKVTTLVAYGEYWRLVTAGLLHTSWLHLLWNVALILFVGRLVESFYGSSRMLITAALSCVFGYVASYRLNAAITMGATPAVCGLIGASLAHGIRYRGHLPEQVRSHHSQLLIVLFMLISWDMLLPQADGVGDLGGLIAGCLLGGLMEGRIAGEIQGQREWLPVPTGLATVAALITYGAYGLLSALPGQADLLRAGRTRDPSTRADRLAQAVAGKPYFLEARLQVAQLYAASGRDEDAARAYQQLLKESPRFIQAHDRLDEFAQSFLMRADRQSQREEWERALHSYQQAIRHARNRGVRAIAHNGYAWTLADKLNRDLASAERHAEMALRAVPDDPAITDTLAWVYFKQGRLRDALHRQLEAVRLSERSFPRNSRQLAELYYHLGAIYERLHENAHARDFYARALRAQPDHAEAAAGLGRMTGPPAAPGRKPAITPPVVDPAQERGII